MGVMLLPFWELEAPVLWKSPKDGIFTVEGLLNITFEPQNHLQCWWYLYNCQAFPYHVIKNIWDFIMFTNTKWHKPALGQGLIVTSIRNRVKTSIFCYGHIYKGPICVSLLSTYVLLVVKISSVSCICQVMLRQDRKFELMAMTFQVQHYHNILYAISNST